jgi:hypothetical protein
MNTWTDSDKQTNKKYMYFWINWIKVRNFYKKIMVKDKDLREWFNICNNNDASVQSEKR